MNGTIQRALCKLAINAYLSILIRKHNRQNPDAAAFIDSFAMTAIWDRKSSRLRIDPMAFTVIVGIVNEHHHWMLLVIYPQEKKSLFLDPMGESLANTRRCLETTRAFMRQKGCNVSRWSCDSLPHGLQQDGTSCGIFALKFAEKVLEGEALDTKVSLGAVNKWRLEVATTLLQESDDLSNLYHYCGCEENEDTEWVCCEICGRWFHYQCVQRPPLDEDYFCPACI
ncbi:hypothetical protein SKAU_G00245500 [Synaphobranchus kaupii]|uniref:Ubiquitin-like protease family profile domain-containing protein n=1 Tax=Synaphobranchus kaupii TaxID=118154 RepID=A0A9Q1F233_SYNKA|nr:hypothetical protein SKAU_G00245500 [Synaphobranchus kaupii]